MEWYFIFTFFKQLIKFDGVQFKEIGIKLISWKTKKINGVHVEEIEFFKLLILSHLSL